MVQDLPARELIEHVLAITGKDQPRIREVLLRGTLVSGASRFRWTGWDPGMDELRDVLATFPDPDPSLPFASRRCLRAVLRGGRQTIEVPREAGTAKGLFQRGSFWDLLMQVTAAGSLVYAGYSYRDHADCYVREFSAAEAERLRSGGAAVRYSTLREQICGAAFTRADLFAARPNGGAVGERASGE